MRRISSDHIERELSEYLSDGENLVSIGIFKKVPTITWMLFTKGFAWLLTQEFYVGVTDHRLIILPRSVNKRSVESFEDVIYADFGEVRLYEGPFRNTMLDIHKMYKGQPLSLRYKSDYIPEGIDLYDFITAVKQRSALKFAEH